MVATTARAEVRTRTPLGCGMLLTLSSSLLVWITVLVITVVGIVRIVEQDGSAYTVCAHVPWDTVKFEWRTSIGSEFVSLLIESFKFEDGLRVRDLTWGFFASSQNIDFPESFILPFFTREVSIVIFSKGGYALSRSQMIKLLTCDILFSPPRHSRENSL